MSWLMKMLVSVLTLRQTLLDSPGDFCSSKAPGHLRYGLTDRCPPLPIDRSFSSLQIKEELLTNCSHNRQTMIVWDFRPLDGARFRGPRSFSMRGQLLQSGLAKDHGLRGGGYRVVPVGPSALGLHPRPLLCLVRRDAQRPTTASLRQYGRLCANYGVQERTPASAVKRQGK